MAPDELIAFVAAQREAAKSTLIELSPIAPDAIPYEGLWPQVLTRHVIRLTDLNEIAARLRKEGKLLFPDWEPRKRVPQPKYRVQRPR
jgi:transposase